MRKFLAFVLSFVMVLSLVACGAGHETEAGPEPQEGDGIPTSGIEVLPQDDVVKPDIVDSFDVPDVEPSEEPTPSTEPVATEGLDETHEPDEVEMLLAIDFASGEASIGDTYFGDANVDIAFIRDRLHINGSMVSDEIVSSVLMFINSYSREGFLRLLNGGQVVDDNVRYGAVLVCKLIDIPYESLWENGFIDEGVASVIMDTLESAEASQ